MRFTILFSLCLIATTSLAQSNSPFGGGDPYDSGSDATGGDPFGSNSATPGSDADDTSAKKRPGKVLNPFDRSLGLRGMRSMGMMGYGKEDEGMEMYMEGMEMEDMDMGMEMDVMSGMMMGESRPTEDQLFQAGLQRAITALRIAKSENEKKQLLSYIRHAFTVRYEQTIARRRDELKKIKDRVAELESELVRREAAKSRVLEVQMQSVQLAAEGLMEIGQQ